MAIKPKFNLSETMSDARKGIEQAVVQLPVSPTDGAVPPQTQPPAPLVQPLSRDSDAGATLARTQQKRNKKSKHETVSRDRRTNARNVFLDDETLWRLELVKKRKNMARAEGEEFCSVDKLIFEAVSLYLDKHFPETKEAYRIINGL